MSNFNWSEYTAQADVTLLELIEQSTEMKDMFSSFTEEQLLQALLLDMPWAKNTLCRYEYMVHAINHSTYHRGQIVSMARSLGITGMLPATDYNIFNTANQRP